MDTTLNIYYSEENEFDLPGPKLFFLGNSVSYQNLIFELEKLMLNDFYVVELNCLNYVKVIDTNRKIIFKSSKDGKVISKLNSDNILTSLDKKYWKEILNLTQELIEGKYSSTVFIELNETEVIEEVNLILEC